MSVNFSVNNLNVNTYKSTPKATEKALSQSPSFKGNSLSPEQAAALANQVFNSQEKIPHIEEKDVNIQVTCVGCHSIMSNTRELCDFRVSMDRSYGKEWSYFRYPRIVRNGNGDERYNGETTALVIPLHSDTPGLRGADLSVIVLNGNIPTKTMNDFVVYLKKIGVIAQNSTRTYLNSKDPKKFMANPKIKEAIAYFFQKEEAKQIDAVNKTVKVEAEEVSKFSESDINMVNIGRKQDPKNTRVIPDYLRYFHQYNKQFLVIHDSIQRNGQEPLKTTAILLPSRKSDWDFVTISIDGKHISEENCKKLVNHLVQKRCANIENENFRKSVVDYLNAQ